MKGHATIQCRAKLSKGGIRRLDGVRSILNRLYNAALEEHRTAWESEQRGVTLYDQMKGLTSKRKEDPEGLGSVAVKAERGMLVRLDRAFKAFFRRCKAGEKPGYPRFRPIARMETIDVVDPQSDHGEEARSGLRHPAQGLSDDPDISLPAVAGRMPVESVADCPQAEPGVCGPDLRGGEAAATEMRVGPSVSAIVAASRRYR